MLLLLFLPLLLLLFSSTIAFISILLLLLLAELNHLTPWLLHVAGAGVFIARVMHAWGLAGKRGASPGRYYGTLFTWVILLCLALGNLVLILF